MILPGSSIVSGSLLYTCASRVSGRVGELTVKSRFGCTALLLISSARRQLSFQRTSRLLIIGGYPYGHSRFDDVVLEDKVAIFSRATLLLQQVSDDDGHNGVQLFAGEARNRLLEVAQSLFPGGVLQQVQVQRGGELVA